MKIVAMIPARYGATRFPGKLMADLGGKPVILRTYLATKATGLFDEVYVVTDSEVIRKVIEDGGGKAILSQKEHECGTDRIAEAVEGLDVDIVVNVQGDEPFVKKDPLQKVISVFEGEDANKIDLASLMQEIKDWKDITDPNYVKVIVDKDDFALYFSRSPIPYPRDKNAGASAGGHERAGIGARITGLNQAVDGHPPDGRSAGRIRAGYRRKHAAHEDGGGAETALGPTRQGFGNVEKFSRQAGPH